MDDGAISHGPGVNCRPVLTAVFFYSTGVLLLVTAGAKLISAGGSAPILQNQDPILHVSFRHLFEIVGVIELILAGFCFVGRRPEAKAAAIAWLATGFLIYRLGLVWLGYIRPCSCLGNLTDALHIPPQTADTTMKVILAYLLIGGYGAWLWLWWRKRKTLPASPAAERPGLVA